MKNFAKLAAIALVAAFVVVGSSASALTSAEIQAFLAQLSPAQLSAIMGTTATTANTASYTFTRDLTVGSTGADVTALQNFLIGKSFNTKATGYFGPMTKAALASYQAGKGITPAVGYFGAKTRASVNQDSVTSVSTTTTTTTTTGTVSTVGVEGTINVTKDSAGTESTVYEGNSMVSVLGIKVEAKSSDMKVERVKLDLGTNSNVYNKIYKKVYLTDASGNVLASSDLNSSTVTRDTSSGTARFTITLAGFNYVVAKDTKQTLYVKFDVYSSIDSTVRSSSPIISLVTDAVRATDGAGIDQYGGGSAISAQPSISGSLSDNATLTISTDPNVLKAATVVANSGSNSDELDKAEIGSFRAYAEKDGVIIHDLKITTTATGSAATEPTAYLFEGSNQIAAASASTTATGNDYSFTSIDQTVAKDATKTYTIKVDVRGATTTADVVTVQTVAVTSAESVTSGNTVSVSPLSSAQNAISFVSKGAAIDLAGTPSATLEYVNTSGTANSAYLTATFNVHIKAVGADAVFATSSNAFAFKLIKDGTVVTTPNSNGSTSVTVFYPATQPTGTSNYSANGFTVARNADATVLVTYKVSAASAAAVVADLTRGATFSVRLNSATYTSGGASISNDFSSNNAWVTSGASVTTSGN